MATHYVKGKETVRVEFTSPEGDQTEEHRAYVALDALVFQETLKMPGLNPWSFVYGSKHNIYDEGGFIKGVEYTVNNSSQARTLVNFSRSLYL